MEKVNFIFFILFIASPIYCVDLPNHIISNTPADVQECAAKAVIERAIGKEAAQRFRVTVGTQKLTRYFKLNKIDDHISIEASDGVSITRAFHHYLKYYLNNDLTWTKPTADLSQSMVLPNVTLESNSGSFFIYHQNVCTWSYSFAWWNFQNWRQHIDWMAMMGITLTIAPIQEYVWNELYLDLGLTEEEIDEHFAGPAFQAWQRMGNIRGWGGPLPKTYRKAQMLLQNQILKAQRELGMTVALPAFAGHVPVAMKRIYPQINFTAASIWNHFPEPYCCTLFLDPNEALFQEIGGEFLKRINDIYGSDHVYFADPYNEIFPRCASVDYINKTAYHIYETMKSVDKDAVWLLQGWMFLRTEFWTDELVKAFLNAVPLGKLVALDLHSETQPQYLRTQSYYGHFFIWCMLHNFGGTLGMYGSADIVNERIEAARQLPNSTMIGVGITPEGINQNYVMYSLALERAWSQDNFELDTWFDQHADITYGVVDVRLHKTWNLLYKSVYSYNVPISQHGKYTLTRRPSLNLKPWIWYNASYIEEAWSLFLNIHDSIPGSNYEQYTYSLVDLTRQFLQNIFDKLYVNLISAFKKKNLERFIFVAKQIEEVFEDLEAVLATNKNFLLGRWLKSAKRMGETSQERKLFELNARNQITTWGPNCQILDYATKQWSGIVIDYYYPRWKLFINLLEKSLVEKVRFDANAFRETVSNEIEIPFSVQTKNYPTKAVGDSFNVSQRIYKSWMQKYSNLTYLHYSRLPVRFIESYTII